jgi:hypothetical protein
MLNSPSSIELSGSATPASGSIDGLAFRTSGALIQVRSGEMVVEALHQMPGQPGPISAGHR